MGMGMGMIIASSLLLLLFFANVIETLRVECRDLSRVEVIN